MTKNYTYKKPDEEAYFHTLLTCLEKGGHEDIVKILERAKCTIETSDDYGRRYNSYKSTICFEIPIEHLESVNKNKNEMKEILIELCDKIMPSYLGFDVTDVNFSPLLEKNTTFKPLNEDLDKLLGISTEISEILPDDIIKKGKEMAEVYFYLYCIENSLRLFIEKVALNKLGENYFEKLQINSNIEKNIKGRKRKEEKNKWLGVRGDSELFYLDFEDLEKIIMNNWDLFKDYFPDQNWITTKIREMADCRNLVAHNSFIDNHGRDVLKTDYVSILKQIDNA